MSLGYGRKQEHPKKPTQTQGEHGSPHRKVPADWQVQMQNLFAVRQKPLRKAHCIKSNNNLNCDLKLSDRLSQYEAPSVRGDVNGQV